MNNKDLTFIQDQIGYTFKNSDLLQQAFVRRSYAKENGGGDNEVLEFIGDKVLDIVVVSYLTKRYGYLASECDDFNSEDECDEFFCELSEGELTEVKRKLVEKKMLAHRIDVLALSDFLIMGKGDIRNNVNEENSVKEDLFEAIIGAVALDSEWDFNEIQEVVEVMLDPDSELAVGAVKNYVKLIQDWVSKNSKNFSVPLYHFEKATYQSTWYSHFEGVSQNFCLNDIRIIKVQFNCLLKVDDNLPIFRGFGSSKSEARKAVCEVAYAYLEENDLINSISTEIENPNRTQAINQLETLSRRGYFSIPVYDFKQEYDNNGNPVWKCECHIDEYDIYYWSKSSSKKEAKKSAAFSMLKYVLK